MKLRLIGMSSCLALGVTGCGEERGSAPERADDYAFESIEHAETDDTYVFGINAHGQTVGRVGDEETGDAWMQTTDGAVETFDFPGAPFTEAFDIDDSGNVAGWFKDADDVPHGFVRDADGRFSQIDVPDAPWTIVLARTSDGRLAGFHGDAAQENVEHGFVCDETGTFMSFTVSDATATEPFGMNEGGTVVGVFYRTAGEHSESEEHEAEEGGFVRHASGEIEVTDPPDGAHASSPLGINGAGDVVGFFEDERGVHGYLRSVSGRQQTLDFLGSAFTVPLKVTSDRSIVGYYAGDDGHVRGFIARPR